jgi:hypothetical protein
VRAALGLAALGEDLGDCIEALDANPIVALPDRAVVVDALIVPKAGSGSAPRSASRPGG